MTALLMIVIACNVHDEPSPEDAILDETAAATDFTFTLPLISRSAEEEEIQWVECGLPALSACDLAVYRGEWQARLLISSS